MLVKGATGLNVLISLPFQSPAEFQYYGDYIQLPAVRKAIHVGSLTYNSGDKVEKHLQGDMLQSVKPWLAAVMNKYKVSWWNWGLKLMESLRAYSRNVTLKIFRLLWQSMIKQ